MKNLIISLALLSSSMALAESHCALREVSYLHQVNGKVVDDTKQFSVKFHGKGLRKLQARNYHFETTAHKHLIIETNCNEMNTGGYSRECTVRAQVFCSKENRVEASAVRYMADSNEGEYDKLAAHVMVAAIKGLPKCSEHRHNE